MRELCHELDRKKVHPVNTHSYVDWGNKLTSSKAEKGEPTTLKKSEKEKIKKDMMQGRDNDPLVKIYEDIADRFEPNHFKNDPVFLDDK
jgi:hypothetical protein